VFEVNVAGSKPEPVNVITTSNIDFKHNSIYC